MSQMGWSYSFGVMDHAPRCQLLLGEARQGMVFGASSGCLKGSYEVYFISLVAGVLNPSRN